MSHSPILLRAAEKLESGIWRWNDGSRPTDETHRDLVLIIYGAAAELDRRGEAFGCLLAVGHQLSDDFCAPFYRVQGRSAAEVIAALRTTAERKVAA